MSLPGRSPGAGAPAVLVLRALGLGDLLTAVPALRALRDAFPDHHHVLATTAGVADLARHARLADEVLAAEPLAPLQWGRLRPDVAMNLHGRGPESHAVLAATGPRRLIAFRSPPYEGPAWRAEEHEVHRWCRLLAESDIPTDPSRLALNPPAAGTPAPASPPFTLIHPGAGSPARRWPPARWAAVARAEARAGRRVVVTGGREEIALARDVAAQAGLPPSAVAAGSTGVLGLAALVARANRVFCGDTGIAHLATALGRPSVVLFGPVSPELWGPPPERPWHIALWAGCTGDPHGSQVDQGLLAIGVADVLAASARLDRCHPRIYQRSGAIMGTVANRPAGASWLRTSREGAPHARRGPAG